MSLSTEELGKIPHFLSASRVPICFLATLVSLATATRGPKPLTSANKHHKLFAAVSARCATAVPRHCDLRHWKDTLTVWLEDNKKFVFPEFAALCIILAIRLVSATPPSQALARPPVSLCPLLLADWCCVEFTMT